MAERLLPRLWVLLAAFLLVALERPFLQRFDRFAFGSWVEWAHPRETLAPWPDDFVAVTIDSRSIAEFRGDASSLFVREDAVRIWDRLHELGARLIVHDFQFVTERTGEVDAAVQAALTRNQVVLPVTVFEAGAHPFLNEMLAKAMVAAPGAGLPAVGEGVLQAPLPPFAKAAVALGHVNLVPDPDGRVRSRIPAFRVRPHGKVLPSIELVALARMHGADLGTMRVESDRLIVDGLRPIPLQQQTLVLELTGPPPPTVSARDLFDPAKEAGLRALVEGRMALVYNSAGTHDVKATALGADTPGGLLLAHGYRTMAAGHAPVFPSRGVVFLPLLAGGLVLAGSIVQRKPATIGALAASAPFLWIPLQIALYRSGDVFLPIAWPVSFLTGSGALLFLHKSFSVVRRMETAEARADAGKAPRGEIALVFTDVQGSTFLWERIPFPMRVALDLHNTLLRSRLEVWRGYEVKTEGDAFMLAFGDPSDALGWCLDVQRRLLAVEWPSELLAEADGAQQEGESGALLWRGLRVRMGIHSGAPEPREDPRTGRMDYFGPVVNKAARVSAMAHGGQIVASDAAWEKLSAGLGASNAKAKSLGTFELKGISAPEPLHEITSEGLEGRRFTTVRRPARTGEHKLT